MSKDYASLLKNSERAIYDLRALYESYGYRLYKTGKFEDYELYARNKSFIGYGGILTFTDPSGRLMALKPDVTLSIAKNSEDEKGVVQKYYYDDEVYRLIPGSPEFREIMQTGIECIGDLTDYDICEVITLAARSLEELGADYILDISHMGMVKGLIDLLALPEEEADAVITCIRSKNAHESALICQRNGISAVLSDALTALINTYGPMDDVLGQTDRFIVGPQMQEAAAELKKIRDVLTDEGLDGRVCFDFSVAGHMGYYDGVIFQGFVEGINSSVLSGGRYDHLMKRMGRTCGAIGFSVSLSKLEGLGTENRDNDVDILFLCDPSDDIGEIGRAVSALRAEGNSVIVQNARPAALRAGRTVRLINGEVRDAQ